MANTTKCNVCGGAVTSVSSGDGWLYVQTAEIERIAELERLVERLTWFVHSDGSRRCRHCEVLEASGHSRLCIVVTEVK